MRNGKRAPHSTPATPPLDEGTIDTGPPPPELSSGVSQDEGTISTGPPPPESGRSGDTVGGSGTDSGSFPRFEGGSESPGGSAPSSPSGGTISHAPGGISEKTPQTQVDLTGLLARPLPPGGLDFGKYTLLSELGRGGMGVVYRALERTLKREVALKLMLYQDVPLEERIRFQREAEANAALKHPNIVAVHEVSVQDGKPFFSMDFVEGKTFKRVIEENPTDFPLLLRILAQVCDGIGYAHRKGIIHRDLKTQNVMVDAEMSPHIMDFGLAARTGQAAEPRRSDPQKKVRLTQMGAVMGTPQYMPPEQAAGRIDEIDTRSDIYSLGVILYKILSGEFPFKAPSLNELLMSIVDDAAPPARSHNPACPWELDRIAMKAIAKRREDRYQTAFELKDDLEAWMTGRPVAAVGGGALYRARKFVRRNRAAVGLSLVAVLLAGAGLGYTIGTTAAERRARRESAAGLVADGRGDLQAAGRRVEAYRESRRAADDARPTPEERIARGGTQREALAAAARLYASAAEKFSSAKGLDPAGAEADKAAGEATIGRSAVKALEDREIEEIARANAELESRAQAAALVDVATARLAATDPAAALDLAAVAAAKGVIDGARAQLLRALGLAPGSQAAQAGLSTVVQKLQALAERERVFERRARLEELAGEATTALAAAEAEKDPAIARTQLRKAITALSDALRIDPADAGLRAKRVQAALALGRLALAAGELPLAEYVVDEVRGLGAGEVQGFLEEVRRARDDEGRYAKVIESAEVAREAGRWKDAAAAYQEALQAVAGREEAEFGLRLARGSAAAADGRHDEALTILAEATPFAERPADRGALERAVDRSRTALADAAVAEAKIAIQSGRLDAAANDLRRAIALKPDHTAARLLLAEVQARSSAPEGTVLVPDGAFTFGTGGAAREAVTCAAFFLGSTEVVNREYAKFVEAGGYEREDLWDAEGWARRGAFVSSDTRPGPAGWIGGRPAERDLDLPVTGISWHEARAYARWKGTGWRLPSEVEWDKAATWDAATRRKQEPPWISHGKDGAALSLWDATWRAYFSRSEPKAAGAPCARNEAGAPLYDRVPCGALDMWGNVRELIVVRAEGGQELPGVRGGSFASRVEDRSSAYRTYRPDPGYRALGLGFRLARSAE